MALRILVIEDDRQFQKIVAIRLSTWRRDASLVYAASLAEARCLLDGVGQPFDLVILDQNLPDGLGWELLDHANLKSSTVLAVSASDDAELPAKTLMAGARHFLSKRQVSEPLFVPLLDALLERTQLEKALVDTQLKQSKMETIRALVATLRHEINNPLGAVMGAAYLVRVSGDLDPEQQKAVALIEESGLRIKHVIDQLSDAASLEAVKKAHEIVFQVPGDPEWEKSKV